MTVKYAVIEEDELACRIAEAMMGLPRPTGLTAKQSLQAMEPDCRATFYAGARAAANHIMEAITAAGGEAQAVDMGAVAGHA